MGHFVKFCDTNFVGVLAAKSLVKASIRILVWQIRLSDHSSLVVQMIKESFFNEVSEIIENFSPSMASLSQSACGPGLSLAVEHRGLKVGIKSNGNVMKGFIGVHFSDEHWKVG